MCGVGMVGFFLCFIFNPSECNAVVLMKTHIINRQMSVTVSKEEEI